MAETVFKASAHLQEGVQVKVRSRDFEIIVDEPESLGGTDTGMNPVEMVLCALGACQAIVASVFAKQHDMTFSDFRVELEEDLDNDGFLGKFDVIKDYIEIRYNINIETDIHIEKDEKFVDLI